MPMNPQERDDFKRAYLNQLEQREQRRPGHPYGDSEDLLQRRLTREEELRDLRREVEQQYFEPQGRREYVNHRGESEWLTPEEYEERVRAREARHSATQKKGGRGSRMNRQDRRKRDAWKQVTVLMVLAGMALLLGMLLTYRSN